MNGRERREPGDEGDEMGPELPTREAHLSDQETVALIEYTKGPVSEADRVLWGHALRCPDCFDVLQIAREATRLQSQVLLLAIQLVGGTLQLLQVWGALRARRAVLYRDGQAPPIELVFPAGRHELTVKVATTDESPTHRFRVELQLASADTGASPPEEVDVRLACGGEELLFLPLAEGKASLPGLAPGRYELTLTSGGGGTLVTVDLPLTLGEE